MTTLQVLVDVPHESEQYLVSSARVRGVSRTRLIKRMVELVLVDKMILSILDDGDRPSARVTPASRPGRPPRKLNVPPRDPLFDGLARHSAPTRRPLPNAQTFSFSKKQQLTKSELQEQLRQAVLNTGGVEVE